MKVRVQELLEKRLRDRVVRKVKIIEKKKTKRQFKSIIVNLQKVKED